jgi:hypothetical protein
LGDARSTVGERIAAGYQSSHPSTSFRQRFAERAAQPPVGAAAGGFFLSIYSGECPDYDSGNAGDHHPAAAE